MYLDEKSIAVIQDLLQLDSETCGFLFVDSDQNESKNLTLFVDSVNKVTVGRLFCVHSRYEKYMWHTHIITSKGYPSAEDIVGSLKLHPSAKMATYPSNSIVFTGWGIWQMTCQYKNRLDDKMIKFLIPSINNICSELYFKTEKGRGNFSNQLIDDIISKLTSFINKTGKFGFEMYFTSWNDIDNKIDIKT